MQRCCKKACQARFKITQGVCNDLFYFTDESTVGTYDDPETEENEEIVDEIESWEYDFGDGETSTEQNPWHIYGETGVYDVKLKITTKSGCVSEWSIENLNVIISYDNEREFCECLMSMGTFRLRLTIPPGAITPRTPPVGPVAGCVYCDGIPGVYEAEAFGSFTPVESPDLGGCGFSWQNEEGGPLGDIGPFTVCTTWTFYFQAFSMSFGWRFGSFLDPNTLWVQGHVVWLADNVSPDGGGMGPPGGAFNKIRFCWSDPQAHSTSIPGGPRHTSIPRSIKSLLATEFLVWDRHNPAGGVERADWCQSYGAPDPIKLQLILIPHPAP